MSADCACPDLAPRLATDLQSTTLVHYSRGSVVEWHANAWSANRSVKDVLMVEGCNKVRKVCWQLSSCSWARHALVLAVSGTARSCHCQHWCTAGTVRLGNLASLQTPWAVRRVVGAFACSHVVTPMLVKKCIAWCPRATFTTHHGCPCQAGFGQQ
jgi:hypothetical protein